MMKKIFDQIKVFLGKLIDADEPTSSKRFVVLWVLLLVTYVVVRFITTDNIIDFIYPTYTLILALLGVAAWQAIIKYRNGK